MIPVGGSSVLGIYGFISAFEELVSQVLLFDRQNQTYKPSLVLPDLPMDVLHVTWL